LSQKREERRGGGRRKRLAQPRSAPVSAVRLGPKALALLGRNLTWIGLLAFVAVLSLTVPFFLTPSNLVGLLLSLSMVGMGSCVMLFCLSSGNIDLSLESIVALSGVSAAVAVNATGNVAAGALFGVAVGALVGSINGLIVTKLKVNALIATTAMMQIVRGLCFVVSNGSAVGVSEEGFYAIGNSFFLGIPSPAWIAFACVAFFGFVFSNTSFGKDVLAIGGNREFARLAGVNVDRVQILLFAVQGLVAGGAGVILASRMTSGQPNSSTGYSFDVISACVLGGVSVSGGKGRVAGVIFGVLMIGVVQNAMGLLNLPSFNQYLTRGGILLAAVIYDQAKNRRPRRRRAGDAGPR
jgi:L-arabinose transport system permease protein